MSRLRAAIAATLFVLATAPAFADEPPPPASPGDAPSGDDSGDNPGLIAPQHKASADEPGPAHLHQVGLGLQLAVGMRAINPYQDTYCGAVGDNGSSNQAYCLARTPMTLDFELTFGVKATLEALLEVRVGVERDFGQVPTAQGPHVLQLAPGARFFFAESGRSKFFSTAQAVLDTTGYTNAGGEDRGVDIGLRNINGFMFDFQRHYGAYLFFGEELGFKRWLSATLEAGIGFQGRYP
jgi:hypothetical protein